MCKHDVQIHGGPGTSSPVSHAQRRKKTFCLTALPSAKYVTASFLKSHVLISDIQTLLCVRLAVAIKFELHLFREIIWASSPLWAVFLPSGRSAEADGAVWAGTEVAVLIAGSEVT